MSFVHLDIRSDLFLSKVVHIPWERYTSYIILVNRTRLPDNFVSVSVLHIRIDTPTLLIIRVINYSDKSTSPKEYLEY